MGVTSLTPLGAAVASNSFDADGICASAIGPLNAYLTSAKGTAMANWYSADLHLDHSRIIDFCRRPFASTAEMNASLIANFQACVAHDDDLWIFGDFAFGRAEDTAQFESWFHSLPGRKHLIIGNHDNEAVISLPWASTEYMAETRDGDQSLVLCHYPMIT